MTKHTFPSFSFAAAFAWHEAEHTSKRVKLGREQGKWYVTICS